MKIRKLRLINIILIISMILLLIFGYNIKKVYGNEISKSVEVKIVSKKKIDIFLIETSRFEKRIEESSKYKVIEEPEEITIEILIKNTCDKYGVPFNVALAISRLETGWFKSDAYLNKHNPAGLSINEVPKSFSTIEEGVEAYISKLSNDYFGIGLDTPKKIGKKYCPIDPSWAEKVTRLMEYE